MGGLCPHCGVGSGCNRKAQGLGSVPICLVGLLLCVPCWMEGPRKAASDGTQHLSPVGGERLQIFLGETLEKRSRWEWRLFFKIGIDYFFPHNCRVSL